MSAEQPVFYAQTVRLIEQVPFLTAESAARIEWMRLGIFVATPDGVADPEVTLQLAVTRDGVIGGTAFNPKSNVAFNIVGVVDKRSQRAVWSYRDDREKRIIMESSIYNLTQPEATGMVHYSPSETRVLELRPVENFLSWAVQVLGVVPAGYDRHVIGCALRVASELNGDRPVGALPST